MLHKEPPVILRHGRRAIHLSKRLLALAVSFCAIVTQPIPSSAGLPLPSWDISTWRACAVVVVNLLAYKLLCFVDGIKDRYCGHLEPHNLVYAAAFSSFTSSRATSSSIDQT